MPNLGRRGAERRRGVLGRTTGYEPRTGGAPVRSRQRVVPGTGFPPLDP